MVGEKLLVLSPIVIAKKGAFEHIPEQYQRAGFARARVDGVVYALDEFPTLDKNYKHTIEIVIDRLVNNPESRGRLVQSVEQALDIAEGKVVVDGNHPLAGKTLNFQGTVNRIRKATREELSHGHVHGAHGHHH